MTELTPDALRKMPLPVRTEGDKQARGNVLIIGGSVVTPGAALLAGLGALRAGAGRLRILFRILLPLMGPPLSTVAVLTFLSVWNDFLWPLVVTSSPDTMTVQLGLSTFQSAHYTNWPELMAGTLTSQLPVLVLFVLGQRFFVSSIANTGIK